MEKSKSKKNLIYIIIAIILIIGICVGCYYYFALRSNLSDGYDKSGNKLSENIYQTNTYPNAVELTAATATLKAIESDKNLSVHFIDIGQGDSIVICFPDGKNMIIDGGDKYSDVENKLIGYIKSLNIKVFDYMILTHSDADHVGSLDNVLEAFEVKNIFMPKLNASYGMENKDNIKGSISTLQYSRFVDGAGRETYNDGGAERKASIIYNTDYIEIKGDSYHFAMFCQTEEYYQAMTNNSSAEVKNGESPICILSSLTGKVVLTGDATCESEDYFMKKLSGVYDCDVLKVGHHGSRTSTGKEFLKSITVESAVISCGENNKYGHPHEETLNTLKNASITNIFRTDIMGDIVYSVTNEGGRFTTEKTINSQNQYNSTIKAFDLSVYYTKFIRAKFN